ncbi:toll-like receptor 4 [Mytilus californianus]|uniref:toll-like receptor 4 n=1 Tax=Mytilus californianus TaxID=6549 RepID=UPI0022473F7E|nr:toll-like receptor 4 [Mytilus californianus]
MHFYYFIDRSRRMANQIIFHCITLVFIANENVMTSNLTVPCKFEKLCSCSFTTQKMLKADCSGESLDNIPTNLPSDLTNISLARNLISKIKNGTFEANIHLLYLDLSSNYINELHSRSFQGLSKLETLIISSNRIDPSAISMAVFKPLKALLHLAIKQKFIDPFSLNVSSLVQLNTLKIDAVSHGKDPFDVKYAHLRFLQEVDVSGFSGYCKMTVLMPNTFKYIPYVKRLDLSKCGINAILSGTFRGLVYLKYLDLSDNRCLKFKGLANVTYDLPSTSLEILRINKIHQTFDLNTIMTTCEIKPLRRTNITQIYLNSNRMQLLEEGAMEFFPKTLKILSIADNEFSFAGRYIGDLFELTVHEVNMSYLGMSHFLKNFEESCDHTLVTPSRCNNNPDVYKKVAFKGPNLNNDTSYTFFGSFGDEIVWIPSQLRKLHLRECKLRYYLPDITFSDNLLEYADFSSNTFYDWQGPLGNLNQLKFFNLSNNYCSKVSARFFTGMPNLTTLLVQNNLLGFVLPGDISGEILAPLTKLEVLDLSDNRITSLPSVFFNAQIQLRTLNLSGNLLETATFEIIQMTKLSHLDISNNRLSVLGTFFTKQLDQLSEIVPDLTVKLSGNPIKCICETIEFIQWLSITKIHVQNLLHQDCRSLQMHLNSSKVIYEYLKKKCSSYTTTIVAVGSWVAIFAFVIIAGIIYRYRWKLRYAYYIVKGKHHGQIKPLRTYDDFQYDAFVSYADEDETFVHRKFLKKLEDDRNISCCVHKRDFLAGNDIATNITSAIHNSRKTVVILSHHFLQSDWCLFEFNMAKMESIYSRSKENIILLVFLEQISSKDLPLNILELIQSKSYIEYPNDEYGDVVFWDKLKETLSV